MAQPPKPAPPATKPAPATKPTPAPKLGAGPRPVAAPALAGGRPPSTRLPAASGPSPTPWPAVQAPPKHLGPSPSDRRVHPRHELLAQVQVTRDSEVYILSTLNVSRGGLFVQCRPAEAPDLQLGRDVEVLIFAPDDTIADVTAQARVARIDDGRAPGHLAGVGLRFTQLDAENTRRLDRLIALP